MNNSMREEAKNQEIGERREHRWEYKISIVNVIVVIKAL